MIALDIYVKNIFIPMLLKDKCMCGFRSITSLPHGIFGIHLRNCFPPLRKTINIWFEEFKGKDTCLVHDWLKQKGLEKLCKILQKLISKTLCIVRSM